MTREEFRDLCSKHGVQPFDSVLDAIYSEILPHLKKAPKPKDNRTQQVIAAYCEAFQAAFGFRAIVPPDVAKRLQPLVQQIGVEHGTRLVQAYVRMPDSWFKGRGYDLETFRVNIQKVQRYVETGEVVTQTQVRQEDRKVSNPFARMVRRPNE